MKACVKRSAWLGGTVMLSMEQLICLSGGPSSFTLERIDRCSTS